MKQKGVAGVGVFRLYSAREKDQYIAAMVAQWEKSRKGPVDEEAHPPFITVSRPFGCMALETGLRIAERLNRLTPHGPEWRVYDKEIVQRIASDLRMNESLIDQLSERSRARLAEFMETYFEGRPTSDQVFRKTVQVVRSLCEKGYGIIIGRGGCAVAGDLPGGLHLRIEAPLEWRQKQVASYYRLSEKEGKLKIRDMDQARANFFHKHFKRNISDPDLYDITLNQARMDMDVVVDIVIHCMESKGLLRAADRESRHRCGLDAVNLGKR